MPPVQITPKLWVMPQPSLDRFTAFRSDGFAKVINNRPDGEEAGQPGSEAERGTCEAAGLHYAHIPVTSDGMSQEAALHFQKELESAPGSVVAHCRSGARSFYLWLMTPGAALYSDDEILGLADKLALDRNAVSERLRSRLAALAGGER